MVQLFREDEGQQDTEGPVQALPSASPGSSTAQVGRSRRGGGPCGGGGRCGGWSLTGGGSSSQDKAVVQFFGGDKGQQDPKVMANAALALPKAQVGWAWGQGGRETWG